MNTILAQSIRKDIAIFSDLAVPQGLQSLERSLAFLCNSLGGFEHVLGILTFRFVKFLYIGDSLLASLGNLPERSEKEVFCVDTHC